MITSSKEQIADYRSKGWWANETLSTLFDTAVKTAGNQQALLDAPDRTSHSFGEPKCLTYNELDAAVWALACELYDAGIRRDDIIVMQMPNIVEIVIAYLAIDRLGAIISPVPMQYGSHELHNIAATLQPKAYISISHFKGERFTSSRQAAFSDETLILAFGDEQPESAQLIGNETADIEALATCQTYAQSHGAGADDIYTICWTSGTTGRPKGVPRSHNHWLNAMIACEDSIALKDGETMLNPFPFVNMASIGGFLYLWLCKCARMILHHPFDPKVFLSQLANEQVVYTVAPPAVLMQLLHMPEALKAFDLTKLRYILSGSAPLSPAMTKGFKDTLGIDVINVFGSNEGTTLSSCPHDMADPELRALYFPRYGVEGLNWSNRIAARMQTKLCDPETGEMITTKNIPGELCVTGPAVFDGYYKSDHDNAEVFDSDGYFRTGDLFEIAGEKDDFYRFVGRCKDLIVRGGMNISPEELDNLLGGYPDISEAAVVGYPDEILSERVAVVAVPKPDVLLTLDNINSYLTGKGLATFKLPEKLVVTDSLPRSPLNKVLRNELSELL